jgi:hypothetical protein
MANPNYDRHSTPPDGKATTSGRDAVMALIGGWREALNGVSYRQLNLESAWRAATDDDRERFAETVTEWLSGRAAVMALIAGWTEALNGVSYRKLNLEWAWRAATDDDRERFAETVTEWLNKRWAASLPASAKRASSQH